MFTTPQANPTSGLTRGGAPRKVPRRPTYLSPLVPPGPAVPKVVWTNHFQGQCQATLAAQGLQHQHRHHHVLSLFGGQQP